MFRPFPNPLLLFLFYTLCVLPPSYATPDVWDRFRALAEAKSPDLRLADSTLEEKSAAAHTALTRWLPRLDLQLSGSKAKDYSLLARGTLPPAILGAFEPTESNITGWAVKFSLPLYRRSIHVGWVLSLRQKDSAAIQRRISAVQFEWRLRNLFGNYLLSAYKLATIESSLVAAKTNERDAKLRFDLGGRTKVDVLRSTANRQSLEAKQIESDRQRLEARRTLTEFSGLTDEEWGGLGWQ